MSLNSLFSQALSALASKSFFNFCGSSSTREALIEAIKHESRLGSKLGTWVGMVEMPALATVLA